MNWVGSAKSLLLGKLHSKTACAKLDQVSDEILNLFGSTTDPGLITRLHVLLSAAQYLTKEDVFSELSQIFISVDEESIYSATKLLFENDKDRICFDNEPRHPVILILDPEVQSLPWESLPCMLAAKQPVSRIPSLQYLSCLWQAHCISKESVVQSGVSADSVFYLINPDSTLPKTQERLETVLKDFTDWEGCSGEPPRPGQLSEVLGRKDVYIYSGHGSGSHYMPLHDIEKLRVRVVALLLGCNSGELLRIGRNLDPWGAAYSYLLGTSPAMVGFLWPVTDVDVDNWTIRFLDYWLNGRQGNMLQAVADQRGSFANFSNTAALVVYGLPISVKSKSVNY